MTAKKELYQPQSAKKEGKIEIKGENSKETDKKKLKKMI